jgi:hypothetical protein
MGSRSCCSATAHIDGGFSLVIWFGPCCVNRGRSVGDAQPRRFVRAEGSHHQGALLAVHGRRVGGSRRRARVVRARDRHGEPPPIPLRVSCRRVGGHHPSAGGTSHRPGEPISARPTWRRAVSWPPLLAPSPGRPPVADISGVIGA